MPSLAHGSQRSISSALSAVRRLCVYVCAMLPGPLMCPLAPCFPPWLAALLTWGWVLCVEAGWVQLSRLALGACRAGACQGQQGLGAGGSSWAG